MADRNRERPRGDRIPAHPPTPHGYGSTAPIRRLLMTPHLVAIGSLLAFLTGTMIVVLLPTLTFMPPASYNWVPLTDEELNGRRTYLSNQCWTCHSYYVRPQDNFVGQYYVYDRISEPGDYQESPNIFGTARTGPDLSQEGGHHPDDWHRAHYWNPRATTPLSLMPRFNFLSEEELTRQIAFNQASGGKTSLLRSVTQQLGKDFMEISIGISTPEQLFPDLVARLKNEGTYVANGSPLDKSPSGLTWKDIWSINSFERGYWLTPDPLPATKQNLTRGKDIFLHRCVGCHGVKANGDGPAILYLVPPPADFTSPTTQAHSDGMFYHRILTSGKGTAMENFGTRLSVEDIWRVVLFLRTVPKGTAQEKSTIPMTEDYVQFQPSQEFLTYVEEHPIQAGPGTIIPTDPFEAAAQWLIPGMALKGDMILLGGKLPITHDLVTEMIRGAFFQHVEKAYNEALARGEELPAREKVFSTVTLEFHAP